MQGGRTKPQNESMAGLVDPDPRPAPPSWLLRGTLPWVDPRTPPKIGQTIGLTRNLSFKKLSVMFSILMGGWVSNYMCSSKLIK